MVANVTRLCMSHIQTAQDLQKKIWKALTQAIFC